MIELPRGDRFFYGYQRRQRDHLTRSITNKDFINIIRRIALANVHLHDDVILIAPALKSGDLPAAHHGFNRTANRFDRYTHVGGPVPIHGDIELRLIQA